MAKLFITTLVGSADQTRASIPFHIATNGAAKNGVDTSVGLMADASELLRPGVVDTIRGIGVPPLKDLFESCRSSGIKFYVWKGCAEARGVSQQDLDRVGATFMTPPDHARMVMEADRNLSF